MTPPSAGEHRWDPLLQEWVIYAPKRMVRPFQGKQFEPETAPKTWTCPFCPDAPEGAGEWVVKQLPNRFASLEETAVPFDANPPTDLHGSGSNYGKNEVILYSQDHQASFGTLPAANLSALIALWQDRYRAFRQMATMRYAFIMENRGKEIGNSMTHPHGQIYVFPYLPPKIQRKWQAFDQYTRTHQRCLVCDLLRRELDDAARIIEENADFVAFVPYSAHWTYEVHVVAKRHFGAIDALTPMDAANLGRILQRVVQRYDYIYGEGDPQKIMPYVMAMQNAPLQEPAVSAWHFHIEFYTPFRGKDKWKFLAGVELGTHTFINDSLPEDIAKTMRDVPLPAPSDQGHADM